MGVPLQTTRASCVLDAPMICAMDCSYVVTTASALALDTRGTVISFWMKEVGESQYAPTAVGGKRYIAELEHLGN